MALAAKEIGKCSLRIGLPLISGFLLTGVLAGPYGLGMLEVEAIPHFSFIDEISLAFIAFAAGSIWLWHILAPADQHWLSAEQIGKLQALVTGGVLTTVAAGHIKKRIHKDDYARE